MTPWVWDEKDREWRKADSTQMNFNSAYSSFTRRKPSWRGPVVEEIADMS